MEATLDPSLQVPVSFVSMEFHQANDNPGSICAIGVTVIDMGIVVSSKRHLVRPYSSVKEFSKEQSEFHGIKREDVESAPLLHEVLKEIYSLSERSKLVVFDARRKAEMLEAAFGAAQLIPRNIHLRCLREMSLSSEALESSMLDSLARALVSVTKDVPADSLKEAEAYLAASMAQKTKTLTSLANAMSMMTPVEGDVSSESLTVAELYLALFEDEEQGMQFDCEVFGRADKRRNRVSLQTVFKGK
jgi:DNA polymerase-3 subunit epsilon